MATSDAAEGFSSLMSRSRVGGAYDASDGFSSLMDQNLQFRYIEV